MVKKSNKEITIIWNENEKKHNIYGISSKMFVKYCNVNSLECVEPVQQPGKVRVHERYGMCTVSIHKQRATRKIGPKSVCNRRSTPKLNARVAEHLSRKKYIYALSITERNVEKMANKKSNISWGRLYIVIGGRWGASILVGKRSREKTTDVCNSVGIVSVAVKMDQKAAAEQDVEMENDQQLESTHGKNCPCRPSESILLVKTNVTLKHAINTSYPYASFSICASVRILYIYLYCHIGVKPLAHIPTLSVVKTTFSVTTLVSLLANSYRLKYIYIWTPRILGKWISKKIVPNRISINNNTCNELGCNCNGQYGE
jgi:hypothetical protein